MDPSESLPGRNGELAVEPPQPEAVLRALETMLAESGPAVDPWWRVGNDEALGA